MSRKFNVGQLPTGSYSISGSFSGSFVGDGSGIQGITATAEPAGPVDSVQFNDGLNVSGSSQFTFEKTTGLVTVTSASIAGLFYPNADGTDRQTIKTDGAGNLFFGYPESITIRVKNVDTITLQKGYPVHNTSSGTSGNIIGVVAADAGDPLLMPAAAILNETLAPEAEGEALLSGFIQGVNTAGFTSGDVVYVAVGGGYTQTKPTGSALIQNLGIIGKVDPTNGSGIVYGSGRANDIPNLTEGYVWVGNNNQVATALATSSIQQVVSSSYAVTASFALNGGGGSTDTGSLLTTASVSLNTITFTKGNGSTFPITVDTGSGGGGGVPDGTVSGSAQITELGFVTSSATASFVLNSQTSSMSVLNAETATNANNVYVDAVSTTTINVIPTYQADGGTDGYKSLQLSSNPLSYYYRTTNRQSGVSQQADELYIGGGSNTAGGIFLNSTVGIPSYVSANGPLHLFSQGYKVQISSSVNDVKIVGHITASGNISASGDITANSFTGSLHGTSSYALTASFLQGSIDSASYASTASYVAASNIDGTVSNALSSSHAQRSDVTDTIDITQGSTNTNRYVTFTDAINSDGALLADPGILYNPFSNTLTVANITGTATLASAAESVEYSNVNNKPTLISSSAQIATDISGAFAVDSASFSTRITNNETNITSLTTATSSYVLNSQTSSMSVATASYVETAQTASYVLQAVSASYAPTAPGIVSSSAQIATDISGAFTADSASFSTRITGNETNINTLINATSSYILASQTSSMSVATASYVQIAETASFLIAPGNNEQIIYNNNGILAGSNKLTFDGNDLDVDGIVYFRNVFNNEVDLPAVATHHGMFAHVHGTGLAYYAHVGSGGWNKLASYDRTNSDNLDIIANATMNAGTFTIAGAGNYLQVSNLRLLSNTISAQDTDGNITLTPDGTGTVDVSSKKITNLATPTTSTDAATKGYVDTATNLTASVVSASAESTDATYYPIFADSNGSAGMPIHTDGELNYNPSTNTLSATNFVGTGSAIEGIVSASYALSASYSVTASHLLGTIDSASYSDTAVTASYALTAETLIGSIETASFAFTASFLQGTIESASYADSALTASYALTASFLQGSIDSASYASTASYVETAQTASYIDAGNITTGTLTNDRLPANINVTNVTASFFTGSFVGDGSQLDGVINTPGGADTYVQINSGSTFLGTGSLVFDYTNQRLGINDSSPAYALEVSNPDPVDTDSVVSAVNGKFLYSNLYTAAQSGSIPDPAVWHGMMIHYQPEGSYLVSHMSQWFRVATYANDGASIDTYGGRTQNSAGTFAPLANVEIANGYLEVDNLKMDVNTISALDANGTIILEPSGSGTVDVSSKRITSVATPTAGTDATNKTYVDGQISTPSASFSTRVTNNETNIATLTAATSSYLTSLPNGVLSGSAQIASDISGSFTAPSASFSTRVTDNETDISTLTAATSSYLTSLPAGVVSGSAQISYTGITDVPVGIISSSAQIASDISGSFGAASASFSTRVTNNETNITTLTAATASYILTSQTSSMSVATASYVEQAVSSSFASTASYVNTAQTASYINPLTQDVIITGSLVVSGSNSSTIHNGLYVTGSAALGGDIDTTTATLYDESGLTSIKYTDRELYDSLGNLGIDYGSSLIYDQSDTLSIDYGNRLLRDSTGTIVSNFDTLGATFFSGSLHGTASWAENVTSASFASTASYVNPLTQDVIITGSLTVSGSSLANIIQGRTFLYDRFGNVTLDSDTTTLTRPTDEQPSIDWGSSELYDVNTTSSVDWANRLLIDNVGVGSISYSTTKRQLYDTASNIVLDFGTAGTATFDGSASFATTASYALTAQTLLGSVTSADTASYILGSGVDGTVSNATNATTAATASYIQSSNIDGVIQPRVTSIASSATPTPNADTTDLYIITALAVGATFGAPTGTPVQGQKLTIRIEDNGGAQSLAYNAIYRAFGAALPTTTTVGKTLYLGCIYNSTDSAWDVVAVAEQV